MPKKLVLVGLALLLALYGLAQIDAAPAATTSKEDTSDSTIGNEGGGGAATSPDGAAAEAAPVGGPVPAGAFSSTEGGAGGLDGYGDETGSAVILYHSVSALLAALGLGTILVSSF